MTKRDFSPETIWDELEKFRVCFMADVSNRQIVARPMSPLVRRNENLIWFVTDRESGKTGDLADDTPVALLFQDESATCYIVVTGAVSLVDDRDRIEELWSPVMKEWFDGPDDPRIVCISFDPREADIWDGPHKIVAGLKLLVTAATGQKTDLGSHAKVQM